jgi:adenylate cyclase
MSRPSKVLIVGLLVGILGVVLSLTSAGLFVEETIGLHLLFKLRGTRQVPPDVVIVSIDKISSDQLEVPAEPEKWPRSLHAQLTEIAAREGAAVITFDIFFEESHSAEYDHGLAKVFRNAGNVVLCGYLRKETLSLNGERRVATADISIEQIVPPITPLAESAVALSVLPLPKIPVRLSQYWTFKTSAGDTPTLPIVAFQVFAMPVHDDFVKLLARFSPLDADKLSNERFAIYKNKSVERLVGAYREVFDSQPFLGNKMLTALESLSLHANEKRILKSLIRMYQSPNSLYLNFYGPPATITTIPYYEVLEQGRSSNDRKYIDLKNKAVFVGVSERLQTEQRDGFFTVFSQPTGVDISGVEIAATAFANLLEDMPIRPVYMPVQAVALFLWGLLLAAVCRFFSPLLAAISLTGISLFHLFAAHYEFAHSGIWYPLIIPLMIQAPLAFFVTVLWRYFDTSKERQSIRKAFGYYLPNEVVDQLLRNIGDIGAGGQVIYGTCMCTDAEKYTTLSESMDSKELRRFLNEYYEALFEPVRRHGGIVSDVVGDSMMALWTTTDSDDSMRDRACKAALEIFNTIKQSSEAAALHLPTRIGLHSGHMFVGDVGAVDHYEYRAVGDIVNTVSRIEGLNKRLGTYILVSAEVLYQLDGFLTRELGEFLLKGKTKPVLLHELICLREESSDKQRRTSAAFSEALSAFKRKSWEKAKAKFDKCLEMDPKDGPSLFYLELCEAFTESPPGQEWEGLVCLD